MHFFLCTLLRPGGLGGANQLSRVQERGAEAKGIEIIIMQEALKEVGGVLEKSKTDLHCRHLEQAGQLIERIEGFVSK